LAHVVYGASVRNYQLLGSRGQSSRSHEAENISILALVIHFMPSVEFHNICQVNADKP